MPSTPTVTPEAPTPDGAGPGDRGPFAVVGRLLGTGEEGGGVPLAVDGAVVIEAGTIVSVEVPAVPARLPARQLRSPFVAPGFIDLQVNGAFGFEVGDDAAALHALARQLPSTGVTAFLPTLISRPAAEYGRAFAAYDLFAGEGTGPYPSVVDGISGPWPGPPAARALGLHLEGPLLSVGRRGAHDRGAIEAADAELMDRLADPRRVRVVTLAPERSGARALIQRLRARRVVVSLGHTNATFQGFTGAVDRGATLATHVFNAMSPLHHRVPGATGAALTDDRVVALMIADGVHTHPAAFKLAVRAKTIDRLALVTDATPGAGLGPGQRALGGQPVVVDETSARRPDGTLAGSTLTLDRAVRNAISFAGLTAAEAVHMVTAVPARVLGSDDRGLLAVGRRADLALLDGSLQVTTTFVGGRVAFNAAGDQRP